METPGRDGRGDGDGVEDPIADALLGGSAYERLRVERIGYFSLSIPSRLAAQAAILVALAAVLPLWLTAPEAVRAYAGAGPPAAAAPTILLVGVFALGVEVLAATGHVGAALVRLRRPGMGELAARRLLAVEDVLSLFGLATGGVAVLVTDAFFLVGRTGPGPVEAYVAAGGGNPFAPSGTAVTVGAVAAAALCASVACLAASRWLARRLEA